MTRCKFCGLEIEFGEVRGVRIPLDPDFGDHRESCVAFLRKSREALKDSNHERRVKHFLGRHRANA